MLYMVHGLDSHHQSLDQDGRTLHCWTLQQLLETKSSFISVSSLSVHATSITVFRGFLKFSQRFLPMVGSMKYKSCNTNACHSCHWFRAPIYHLLFLVSSSSASSRTGSRRQRSLRRDTQNSLSPDTSSSFSGRTPRCFQASRVA